MGRDTVHANLQGSPSDLGFLAVSPSCYEDFPVLSNWSLQCFALLLEAK